MKHDSFNDLNCFIAVWMLFVVLFIGLGNAIGEDPTGDCAEEIGLALGMMTKLTTLNIGGK